MRVSEQQMLGVRIGTRPLVDLVGDARASIAERTRSFIFACANPHSLVVAQADEEFRRALNGANVVVADGVGCLWGARLTGATIGPRITGTDFFLAMMGALNQSGGRAFFFGSRPEVLAKLKERCAREFPRVEVGALSPPFGVWPDERNREMIGSIRSFRPDVLWVGMTAPKQEKWVAANAGDLRVPVVGSIGAVFDYYAGFTKRAPRWICDLGLEWLYRLPREPRRLWRRTFVSAPLFFWSVLRERFARQHD
jgi:N-acetylglucosaminyldiphosphoundecaprenol N-acetyl-beta-D-mannosaminyltransferase